MKMFTDDLLSKVDQALMRFGPINVIINTLMKLMIPVTTAKAGCGAFCGITFCTQIFCGGDYNNEEWGYFSYSGTGCDLGEVYGCYMACVC